MITLEEIAAALNLEANLPNVLPESSNTDISVFFDTGSVWGVDYDSSIAESNILRAQLEYLWAGFHL